MRLFLHLIIGLVFCYFYGNGADVVVTMTTSPTRIYRLEPVLQYLTEKQTQPPNRIIINIPNVFVRTNETYPDDYSLPSFLSRYPTVRVNRCGRDYGPATKLIPTLELEKDPKTVIVAVDDDSLYFKWTIEYVSDHATESLGEWVVAGRCGDKSYLTPSQWTTIPASNQPYFPQGGNSVRDRLRERHDRLPAFPRGQPCCCSLFEGFATVSFLRSVFDKPLKLTNGTTLTFMQYMDIALKDKHCFVSDDWVLSNFMVLNDIYGMDLTGIVKIMHMDAGEDGTVRGNLHHHEEGLPYAKCMKYLESQGISVLKHVDVY